MKEIFQIEFLDFINIDNNGTYSYSLGGRALARFSVDEIISLDNIEFKVLKISAYGHDFNIIDAGLGCSIVVNSKQLLSTLKGTFFAVVGN